MDLNSSDAATTITIIINWILQSLLWLTMRPLTNEAWSSAQLFRSYNNIIYNDSYNNCAMAKSYYYKRPPLIEPHLQNFCSDLQQHRQCWDRNNLLDHCFVSFYKTWLLLRPFDCIESRNLATLCSPRHALLIVIAPLWLHDMTLLPSVATIQQKIEWIQVGTARKKVCYLNH